MDTLCLILAIIGAVNWGLVGFARFDLVAWIFGGQTAGVSRVIYAIGRALPVSGALQCCSGSAAVRRHKNSGRGRFLRPLFFYNYLILQRTMHW